MEIILLQDHLECPEAEEKTWVIIKLFWTRDLLLMLLPIVECLAIPDSLRLLLKHIDLDMLQVMQQLILLTVIYKLNLSINREGQHESLTTLTRNGINSKTLLIMLRKSKLEIEWKNSIHLTYKIIWVRMCMITVIKHLNEKDQRRRLQLTLSSNT